MAFYAYLRVSTIDQTLSNQKLGLLEYCNARGMVPLTLIEEKASGKIPWRQRRLGDLLEKAKKRDVLVVSEISRLGRSTLQVLEILETAAQKGISVHIVKNNIIMDGSLQSTITATILGLAATIEREFISARTKEALEKCKREGKILGRPKGQADKLKLDNYHSEITGYLKLGINKRVISKLMGCSPSTLYAWLERRRVVIKKYKLSL